MRSYIFLLGVLLAIGMQASLFAAETTEPPARFPDAIVTDRPHTSEASVTVGRHRFQIETSFAFGRDTEASTATKRYSFPTLLRFGILEPLEIRLEGEMYTFQSQTGGTRERGITDMAVGLKTHVVDNRRWIPSLGFLAHLSLPTGHDAFSSNVVEPIFKMLADWELPAHFSLGTNYGLDIPARDATGDKFARALYAVELDHPTPFLKDRLRVFVEGAGAIPLKADKASEHTLNTGLVFLVTSNMQLDSFVRIGLTEAAQDVGTGLGFSWRL